jgi:hypothetical protein
MVEAAVRVTSTRYARNLVLAGAIDRVAEAEKIRPDLPVAERQRRAAG